MVVIAYTMSEKTRKQKPSPDLLTKILKMDLYKTNTNKLLLLCSK